MGYGKARYVHSWSCCVPLLNSMSLTHSQTHSQSRTVQNGTSRYRTPSRMASTCSDTKSVTIKSVRCSWLIMFHFQLAALHNPKSNGDTTTGPQLCKIFSSLGSLFLIADTGIQILAVSKFKLRTEEAPRYLLVPRLPRTSRPSLLRGAS